MKQALTLSLWALNCLPSDQLPDIAVDWLANGLDSPSLRQLAGVSSPVMSEVGPMFEEALAELVISIPPKEDALRVLARYYAQQIVEGTIAPHEGARKLWWDITNAMRNPSDLLLSFAGAASELDELPDRWLPYGQDRQLCARQLEATIVSNARRLLNETQDQNL